MNLWHWLVFLAGLTAGALALGYGLGRWHEREVARLQRRSQRGRHRYGARLDVVVPPPSPVESVAQASARLQREIADHVPALRRQREMAMADTQPWEDRPTEPAPFFPDTAIEEPRHPARRAA